MVRGIFFLYFFFLFGLQPTARLKLQFQSGTPLFKSLDPPLFTQHESNAQNVVLLA